MLYVVYCLNQCLDICCMLCFVVILDSLRDTNVFKRKVVVIDYFAPASEKSEFFYIEKKIGRLPKLRLLVKRNIVMIEIASEIE